MATTKLASTKLVSTSLSISITQLLVVSVLLRVGFFAFGLYQDKYMPVKYTDIDYLVFSDAARFIQEGKSPYERDTYRYTPLLAWMLVPNGWGGIWYSFGKALFMVSDLITGVIIMNLLKQNKQLSLNKILGLSSIWLLNPMVITISTRGSSESVLTVLIMLSLYYLSKGNLTTSAVFLGLSIHFKFYPVIYLASVMYYLSKGVPLVHLPIVKLVNWTNLKYLIVTLITLTFANSLMYYIYGYEFFYHSYLYHLTRIDHRHNFSIYNVMLYYKSAIVDSTSNIEKYAFIPQLLISGVFIPLKFAREDVLSSIFLQTFAFVMFNKVMTSQYFIWFLIFLPHYLSRSKFLGEKYLRGIALLVVWVASQGLWLFNAYNLEFLGISTFDVGLLYSAIGFFLLNCWILGEFIDDLSGGEYIGR